jgi:hypothetical protein
VQRSDFHSHKDLPNLKKVFIAQAGVCATNLNSFFHPSRGFTRKGFAVHQSIKTDEKSAGWTFLADASERRPFAIPGQPRRADNFYLGQ